MGNANGREEGPHDDDAGSDDAPAGSNGERAPRENHAPAPNHAPGQAPASESVSRAPPTPPPPAATAARAPPSPLVFAPQIPMPPFQRSDGPVTFNQSRQNESQGIVGIRSEGGIPTVIAWQYGGSDVVVEGSWDNWGSRRRLQRSGKDYSILMVLPSGVYHYKFIVDGQRRYCPDVPHTTDEMGQVCNILEVDDYVPENLDSVAEFEVPSSPDSSYSQVLPAEDDFAKEPVVVPSQLHLAVLDTENSDEIAPVKPQHVVLNHLFLEKGRTPQSVLALGLTHRFQSKYVTVVLYKQLRSPLYLAVVLENRYVSSYCLTFKGQPRRHAHQQYYGWMLPRVSMLYQLRSFVHLFPALLSPEEKKSIKPKFISNVITSDGLGS